MSERFQNLCFEAIEMQGIFGYRKKIAEELLKVTKQQVIDFFAQKLTDVRQLYILSPGRTSKVTESMQLKKKDLLYI